MKLADSFTTPRATEWAALRVGECPERFLWLSRLNDMQEICQIRGPSVEHFCELAERAGGALPTAWFPDEPILFFMPKCDDAGIPIVINGSPIGIGGPRPVVNRGPVERWVGFVFSVLKWRGHPALAVRWLTGEGPLSCALATLDRNLYAASVLAIDLTGLAGETAPAPTAVPTTSLARVADTNEHQTPLQTSVTHQQIATLQETAIREYAGTAESFWLAAGPSAGNGLRVDRCNRDDPAAGAVRDGVMLLPWGCLRPLGSANLGDQGRYTLLSFSRGGGEELERFHAFARQAGAVLVAAPPAWFEVTVASDPVTTWVALLFFGSPTVGYVSKQDGGGLLLTAPWAASLTAIRAWADSGIERSGEIARQEKQQTPDPGAASDQLLPARHSKDFRSVHWYGCDYSFSPTQAACVKVLWEAWENGTPELGQATILEHPEVEAESERLIDVFKGHPAWGKMIVKGRTAGAYRLAEPTEGS
jgi:hypothetical protein